MPELVPIPDLDGTKRSIRVDHRQHESDAPTLVLLGGMTQTISSWSGQIRPLSRGRSVLAYETRGQGSTELLLEDCSPQRHVEDFAALLSAVGIEPPVDLCGFSFGAKIALGIAATRPELVGKLVVTGVGLDRTVLGRVIVEGWRASLRTGDLEALARVSLADILGPSYLEQHAELIDSMIATSISRNRYEGIAALFEGSMNLPEDSPWRPAALAERVKAQALCLGGAADRIAPPAEVAALAERLGAQHQTFEDCGHTVPIEAPQPWRDAVERFVG